MGGEGERIAKDKPVTVMNLAGQTTPLELTGGVGDFLRSFAYTGVREKADGFAQALQHATPIDISPSFFDKPQNDNMWTKAGAFAGNVADFLVLAKTVGMGRQKIFGRAAAVPFLEAGVTGTIFSGLQPVNDANFATEKRNQLIHGFTTFATMDGIGWGLNKIPAIAASKSFWMPVGVDAASGIGGGVAHAGVGHALGERNFSDAVGPHMIEYAAFNVLFGAGSRGWDKGAASLDRGIARSREYVSRYAQNRAEAGKPLFSLGPFEVLPRGYTAQAHAHATQDGLTGLLNKRGGEQAGEFMIANAKRGDDPASVMYSDLDGFKAVNDKLGHNYGDRVLQMFANGIRNRFHRGTDMHVRDGGDEFMVLMPHTPLANAEVQAAKFEGEFRVAAAKEAPHPVIIAGNYKDVVQQIRDMPRTVEVAPGETLSGVAKRLLTERSPLTGESVTDAAVATEAARLQSKVGGKPRDPPPATVAAYTEAELAALADKAAFRFLPQLGQILKTNGLVTEAQIQEALAHQKIQPLDKKPLLGEILEMKGLATAEQITRAFGAQTAARKQLQMFREQVFSITPVTPSLVPPEPWMVYLGHGPILNSTVRGTRGDIPDVWRPNLEKNGVRVLQPHEPGVNGELVVGTSTGVVQYQHGENWHQLKERGDQLMYQKKVIRKGLGLRQDRVQ